MSALRTSGPARAGQYLALLAYLVFLAFPFLWLVSIAFKPAPELASLHPTWIPKDPTLDNFRQAFDEQPLLRAAANSLLAAVCAAVIAVAVATPLAYVTARHRGRLAGAATGWVVISQAFPFVLVIIPLFLILKNLHLINSVAGLVLVYVVWSLPFALWMLMGYVRAVPAELEEAAAVDGAGRIRTLVSVTAPCSSRASSPPRSSPSSPPGTSSSSPSSCSRPPRSRPCRSSSPTSSAPRASPTSARWPPRPSSRPCRRSSSSESSRDGSRAACSPGR